MRFLTKLSFLLLIAVAVNAAPGRPGWTVQVPQRPVNEVFAPRDDDLTYRQHDVFSHPSSPWFESSDYSQDSGGYDGVVDMNFTPYVRDQPPAVIQDLERRLHNDLQITENYLSLIRRMFPELTQPHPVGSLPGDLGFPVHSFGFGSFEDEEEYDDSDDDSDEDSDDDSDEDQIFSFHPHGFDFDKPAFPSFPKLPEPKFPQVDDLPPNYKNSTHEVHFVDGKRVEVNQTINKNSGDGFYSIFHHQVTNIRPHDQGPNNLPDLPDQSPSDLPDLPDQSPSDLPDLPDQDPSYLPDEGPSVLPEQDQDDQEKEEEDMDVGNEEELDDGERVDVNGSVGEEGPFIIPEVENEVPSSGNSNSVHHQPAESANPALYKLLTPAESVSVPAKVIKKGKSLRTDRDTRRPVLRSLNSDADFKPIPAALMSDQPKTAPYRYHPNSVLADAEEVEVDSAEQPPPDLSSDTRVNHVAYDHQGLVMVDPNAEIFDLDLVLAEAERSRPKEEDE